MSLRRKTLRGVFWSSLKGWSASLIGAVVFVVLARLLDPEDFGLVAMAAVFTALVGLFVDAGVSSAVIQRQRLEAEHLDTAFWLNLGLGVVLCLLALGAAPAVAWLYGAPILTGIVRWLSLSFIFVGARGVAAAVIRRDFGFRALALRSIVASLIAGITAIAMALAGFGVWSLVGQRLAESFSATILVWIVCPWKPGRRFKLSHVKDLLSFGVNILGSRCLVFCSRRSDHFLIGYFLGNVALGYYYVGYRLVRVIVELLAKSVSIVLMPALSRLQSDRDRMRGAYCQTVHFAGLITMPAFVGVTLVAPELTEVLFGPKWDASASVMRLLALAGLLQGIAFVNAPTFTAAGKPSWSMWLNAVDAVSSVIVITIAVQWKSITIVALAYTLRAYLLFPLRLSMIRKLLGLTLSEYTRQLVPTFLACLVMTFAVAAVKHMAADLLGAGGLLAVCVCVACIVYVAAIVVADINGLRGLGMAMKMALPIGANAKTRKQSGTSTAVADDVTHVS